MKKVFDFIKSNINIVKWTVMYFLCLYLILRFIFKFDMFSYAYWWKFFHATLHGFVGMVFGLLIYTAIPIYIATVIIIYRRKQMIITIPFIDKIFGYVSKLFPKKPQPEPPVEETKEPENKLQEPVIPEYPADMPPELRIPYMRAKNHMSFIGTISVYNKPETKQMEPKNENESPIPIPTDFDISDSLDMETNDFPIFKDINFDDDDNDDAQEEETTLDNNTTKYFTTKNIDFETYKQFVATEKYVIYEHNDGDFWIMDEDTWFASGKQIDSPIEELIELAKQNGLIPVLYLQSQNIMDIEETTNNLESKGVRVIKSLDEL